MDAAELKTALRLRCPVIAKMYISAQAEEIEFKRIEAVIVRFDGKHFHFSAELRDGKSNSIIIVKAAALRFKGDKPENEQ